jgi:hypothetical protein
MDRTKRKEIAIQLAKERQIEFKKSLPVDENIFQELFDTLDQELPKQKCNHTPFLTIAFLEKNDISNVNEVLDWLNENGGFCDCEILANIEDLFEYLNPPKTNHVSTRDTAKQKINSLKTDFGFCIEKIPLSWNLVEITSKNKKEYQFKIGKSNNCTVSLQSDFAFFESDNDELWKNLWINETQLHYNLDNVTIERTQLGNYSAIIVKTKDWIPVKIWSYNNKKQWVLRMDTEFSRYKNDVKELEKLLNNII